ncbi:hypothetical protein ANCDUO_00184 [Ancylostoma duodenale]|uniref:Uncharacterized protein n=1 Tax=Ancylostoma duodenale TaxID=51022 RepID=A0A0C2H6I7_9BILA|nr:hypothetical protein ANCDUO_00184 [Ancylostoma duodenale]
MRPGRPYIYDTKSAAKKMLDNPRMHSRSLAIHVGCPQSTALRILCKMDLCVLALGIFSVGTDGHALVIIVLTISADFFALSNPWLLLALSASFRSKFIKTTTVRGRHPVYNTYSS